MTINIADNSPRISYSVADGATQTSFTVPFEFFDDEDLNVYVDGTLKTLASDYTVSGGDGSTGTVTISVTGASGGSTVVITRDITLERTTDFPVSGAFNIVALNTELDRLIAVAADLDDRAARALQLTDFDVAAGLTLPELDSRKGTILAFNSSTGAVEAGPTTTNVNQIADVTDDIARLADIEDGTLATNAIQTVSSISTNVTTVSGISANVTTVAGISSNVTTVAGISSNVTTVAGVSTDVTTVAGISSDVTTVANDGTDIGVVSTNIANVNTVAGISTNVTTVAGVSSDVTTVAGISADVATLADIEDGTTATNALSNAGNVSSEIVTVAGQISPTNNISTVAGVASDVSTVAGISANVTTVAGVSADVTSVAGISSDVSAVGTIASNVTTVAGISANVTTVAGISTNVSTVAGISANVTTVAGDTTNIGTIATNLTGTDTIGTVAGSISNVNSVGNAIASVNTVASNLTDVQSFANTYRIGTTDPTTSLDTGDLFFNTSSNTLKVYTGSAWEQGVTAGSGFLPLSGGTMTGDLNGTNVILTGYLRGPASFTIDPAAHGDNTGTVVIAGNLQVDGTTTTINSTTLDVDDLNITVASGAADAAAANGAGLTVDGASATLTYASTGDKFVFNKQLDVADVLGFTNWTITESGGSLYFATGGVNKMKLDASGNLDVVGNVNTNATIT